MYIYIYVDAHRFLRSPVTYMFISLCYINTLLATMSNSSSTHATAAPVSFLVQHRQ